MRATFREIGFIVAVLLGFGAAIIFINYMVRPPGGQSSSVVEKTILCPEGGGPCITTEAPGSKQNNSKGASPGPVPEQDTPKVPHKHYDGEQRL